VRKTLRVGVVGAGAWTTAAYIPAFHACDGVVVVALCEIDRDRGDRTAREAGIPSVYPTLEAMLATEQLDMVAIATPTATHASMAIPCLSAGLHVLCEKPLAYSVTEARAMAEAARTTPTQTKVGFTMRYAPAVRRLRELVADNALGKPYLIQLFLQNGQFLDPSKPRHWKMTRRYAGAGAAAEYGIHGLDLARWLFGEVSRVCATGRTFVSERPAPASNEFLPVDVEDSCCWLMEFASGALAICHAGWSVVGSAPGLEIRAYGSRAAAQVILSEELPGSEVLRVADPSTPNFTPVEVPTRLATPIPPPETWRRRFHQNLVSHFIDEIRRRRPEGPDFEDGLRAQELLEAVVRSMAEDRWVSVCGGNDNSGSNAACMQPENIR